MNPLSSMTTRSQWPARASCGAATFPKRLALALESGSVLIATTCRGWGRSTWCTAAVPHHTGAMWLALENAIGRARAQQGASCSSPYDEAAARLVAHQTSLQSLAAAAATPVHSSRDGGDLCGSVVEVDDEAAPDMVAIHVLSAAPIANAA